jgi:hypothetical protein
MSTPAYILTFTCGPDRAEITLFPGGAMLLGRDRRADIQIRDRGVSPLHALIEHTADGPLIKDLGSLNGTHVNGHRITAPWLLFEGDVLTIGATVVKLEGCARPPKPEPPNALDRLMMIPGDVVRAAQQDAVLFAALDRWVRTGQIPCPSPPPPFAPTACVVYLPRMVDASYPEALAHALVAIAESKRHALAAWGRDLAERAPRWPR